MTDLPTDVLLALLARDEYRCVRCGEIPDGTQSWTAYRRRAGDDSAASLMVLCGSESGPGGCYALVRSDRADAYRFGWVVPPSVDPRRIPVLVDRGSRWLYLGDGFTCSDNPPALERVAWAGVGA